LYRADEFSYDLDKFFLFALSFIAISLSFEIKTSGAAKVLSSKIQDSINFGHLLVTLDIKVQLIIFSGMSKPIVSNSFKQTSI
jgi:hypothetical protein